MKKQIYILIYVIVLLLIQNAASAVSKGKEAPALTLRKILQGPSLEEVTLTKMKGNILIIEFWATWCGPCRKAIPHMNGLARRYEGKNVHFLSISREDPLILAPFLATTPMNTWVASDSFGKTSQAYGAKGVPHCYLIDSSGIIVWEGDPQILTTAMIDDLLAGRQPPEAIKENKPTGGPPEIPLSFQGGNDPLYDQFNMARGLPAKQVPFQTILRPSIAEGTSITVTASGEGGETATINVLNYPLPDLLAEAWSDIIPTEVRVADPTGRLPKGTFDYIFARQSLSSLQEGWNALKKAVEETWQLRGVVQEQERETVVLFAEKPNQMILLKSLSGDTNSVYTLKKLARRWERLTGKISEAEGSEEYGVNMSPVLNRMRKKEINETEMKTYLIGQGIGFRVEKRQIRMLILQDVTEEYYRYEELEQPVLYPVDPTKLVPLKKDTNKEDIVSLGRVGQILSSFLEKTVIAENEDAYGIPVEKIKAMLNGPASLDRLIPLLQSLGVGLRMEKKQNKVRK